MQEETIPFPKKLVANWRIILVAKPNPSEKSKKNFRFSFHAYYSRGNEAGSNTLVRTRRPMSGVATRWGVSTVVCRDRRQINRESKTRAVFPTTEIVADSPRVVARSKYPRHENRTVCRKGQCVLFIRLILFRAISQVISNETCRKQTGVSDQMIDDIGMICIRLLTRNIHIYIYVRRNITRTFSNSPLLSNRVIDVFPSPATQPGEFSTRNKQANNKWLRRNYMRDE